jgi:hypothetical protein
MKKEYIIQDKFAEIKLDKAIYPLIAIKKAISNFFDDVYVRIEEDNKNFIINFKLQNKQVDLEKIIGEFYNECLRESLRYEISFETKNIRELIVGRALYTTCIMFDKNEDNQEQTDELIYEEDNNTEYSLEDIAVNWFEKYEDSEEKKC